MMNSNKQALLVPVLVVTVGVGWLLTTQGYGHGINWVWSLGLAVVGVLMLAMNGIDKVSIVAGPIFLVGSAFSVLRQTSRLSVDAELPILMIVVGLLLFLARLPAVPAPAWIIQDAKPQEE